jgi:hypothetical protein
MPRLRRSGVVAVLALSALTLTACSSRSAAPPAPGMAPVLVIERFLQAANSNDIQTMGRLFGTSRGSVLRRDPREQVEQRMFAIASILRHDDYVVEGEQVVPGRIGEAVRINVRLTVGERRVSVPFTVVRTRSNEWLVEQIDLQRALQGRAAGRR